MKTKLILLDTPIIVSDNETLKPGDYTITYPDFNIIQVNQSTCIMYDEKIIAGIDDLPEIDFNDLEGEFGWIDVEKFASEKYSYKKTPVPYYKQDLNYEKREGFIEGFEKAQSLNEKKFSLEDMKKAIEMARIGFKDYPNNSFKAINNYIKSEKNRIIQSLQQLKVFDIEIEMDPVYLSILKEKVLGYKPKITNNKIKILKKL